METEVKQKLPFLDVQLDINPPPLVTSVFRKSTCTGLLTNFPSFATFPYKLGLIRTLVDRTFKINKNWISFHNNIKELANIPGKNQFPSSLVNRTVKQYVIKLSASFLCVSAATTLKKAHTLLQLPFVGPFLSYAQRRIKGLTWHCCKNFGIKLVFAPYKIKNLFSAKDAISKLSRSRVVNKFFLRRLKRMLCRRGKPISCYTCSWATRTFFGTFMGQKHAELCAQKIAFQSLTPPPRLFNWKSRRPYISGGVVRVVMSLGCVHWGHQVHSPNAEKCPPSQTGSTTDHVGCCPTSL